jgi:aspartyl-tRNA(Asn)/glutamyl-tRNA(Gln) amidotransferase subunit A
LDFPPRISGRPLRVLAKLAQSTSGASLLFSIARRDMRLGDLEKLPPSAFGEVGLDNRPIAGRTPRGTSSSPLALPATPPWSGTSATLNESYASGKTTPTEVVRSAFARARELGARKPSVGPLLDCREEAALKEAAAATERWRSRAPIGPLDGVPIAIKEEMSVAGLPVRAGSDLTDATPAAGDGTCVARLRAAGAIVLGTTMMTEYGMTPLGFNPKRVMPRNPHGVDRLAGGSSTGSGVAVATGVVPVALGADGGGSIRIPSALCGVFGIKPTWGRVSRTGDVLSGSVGHLGPIASSTLDLARFLEVASGFDPADSQTEFAPARVAGSFVSALTRGVAGLRVGVEQSEWGDASAEVANAGRAALRALEAEGAVLVDVRMELARYAAPIGYLTISLEALAAHWELLQKGASFNADLAISHAVMERSTAIEYVQAQRLRSQLRRELATVLRDVDVLALPTTVNTAPKVTDAAFDGGFLDARAVDAVCRFNFLGNLTGLPALSAPVGVDGNSLPIGLQFVGDAWDEATVLAVGAHLERLGVAVARQPLALA